MGNTNTMITANTHTRSPTLIPRIMLLSGFAACFLLVVLMRPTSPSSQHRSCMKFQNTSVFQGPANLKAGPDYKITVINPNDIVYFRATELSWGSNNKRSRYNVESDFEPELLSSDNSAERSNSKEQTKWIEFSARTLHALDILKDKFKSLSLDTTVEEIWPEYDHYYADYYGSKEGSYIGGGSDVVLNSRMDRTRIWNHSSPAIVLRLTTKVRGNGIPPNSMGSMTHQASTKSPMTIRLTSRFGRRKSMCGTWRSMITSYLESITTH